MGQQSTAGRAGKDISEHRIDDMVSVDVGDDLEVDFDYPQSGKEHKAWWMLQLPVEKTYSFDPVSSGLSAKQQKLVIGSEACIWTEDIPENEVFSRTFPRMWAFAETVWSDKKQLDFKSFKKRVSAQASIFEKSGNDFFKE